MSQRISKARERAIVTSARLFRERGFDSVTVEDILIEANIARSSFYRFFNDKEDLLQHILNPVFDAMADQLEDIDLQHAESIMNAIADSYIAAWHHSGDALLLTASLGESIFPLVKKTHNRYAMGIYQAMDALSEVKLLRNDDAKLSALLLAQTGVKILQLCSTHAQFENVYRSTLRGMILKW